MLIAAAHPVFFVKGQRVMILNQEIEVSIHFVRVAGGMTRGSLNWTKRSLWWRDSVTIPVAILSQ